MSWFRRLTGFEEAGYHETQDRLEVRDGRLHSSVNGRSFGIGTLELVSLDELRRRAVVPSDVAGLKVDFIQADARRLHRQRESAGALFQVASQFNLLEMVDYRVTPELGVACYEGDPTQGPACAIAAGAATIFRNYFAPVGGRHRSDLRQAARRTCGPRHPAWRADRAPCRRPLGDAQRLCAMHEGRPDRH